MANTALNALLSMIPLLGFVVTSVAAVDDDAGVFMNANDDKLLRYGSS